MAAHMKEICPKCGSKRVLYEWSRGPGMGQRRQHVCRHCETIRVTSQNHLTGKYKPYTENKESSLYLGVHIAERVLSSYFDGIIRMPNGTPGYDFICQRGYKIDVKCACLSGGKYPKWSFAINHNTIADYFLCLAFDYRDSLEPMHIWLIPSERLNKFRGFAISRFVTDKWKQYEKPLDRVIESCNILKNEVTA